MNANPCDPDRPLQPEAPDSTDDQTPLSEDAVIDAAEDELDVAEDAAPEGPAHRRIVVTRDPQRRLDVFLQQRLKGISRSRIQKLIDLGGVTVNDKPPKASTVIRGGDVIDVILPPRAQRAILPEPIPLEVLYEDQDCLVINKQANLLVHPARGHLSGTLINGLAYRFQQQQLAAGRAPAPPRATRGFSRADRDRPGGRAVSGDVKGLSHVGAAEFRPGIIHRLDKNTTGCIVVAKNDEAHWLIARQFEDRTTLKAYLALVHGNFDTAGGVIDQPIGKHPTIREACAVRHDSAGKSAVTIYRVREQYRGYSLVELELKTGRTHQIRVHLSYLGLPIVGDIVYGGEPIGRRELDDPPVVAGGRRYLTFARSKHEGQRIEAEAAAQSDLIIAHPALHAALLSFRHPRAQQMVRFTAPLHEPMATLVRELRRRWIDGPVATNGYWVDLAATVPVKD